MASYNFIVFVALALLATVIASPVTQRSIKCTPVGKPSKLVNYNSGTGTTKFFETVKTGKTSRLSAVKASSEQFQFYQCSIPSDKYRKQRDGVTFGQVRSTKYPELCLTPNNNLVHGPASNDGWINTVSDPAKKDGSITFQPCATVDSDEMRRQWLALEQPESDEKCRLPYLKQEGRKGDVVLGAMDGDLGQDQVSFYLPFKAAGATAYLHDTVPRSCK